MLSQSQARLLKWHALWLAEHNLNLLWARDRNRALYFDAGICFCDPTENKMLSDMTGHEYGRS